MALRLFFFFLFNFTTVFGAVDFTCLPYKVQKNGVFPRGASGVNTFPKDYSCTIDFYIPNGYIVVFLASALNADQFGEHFTITDTMDKDYQITSYEETVYAPASSAKIQIVNENGFPAYFVKWEYVHIASYKTVKEPEGVLVSLAIPAKRGLVFSSGEGVVLATSGRDYYIQVYDGYGLGGDYLGRLSDLTRSGMLKAKGSSLTLTTFGSVDTSQNGYVIGVYATSVQQLSYSLVNLDEFPGAQMSARSAVTFFSNAGNYDIVSLTADGNTVVEVRPQTPVQGGSALLTYKGQNFDYFMPQQILGSMFTVFTSNSSASISFSSKSFWLTAYHGRKGKMISANAWTPGAEPSQDNGIEAQELMTFHFNVDKISINHSGDQLNVKVGNLNNSTQYSVSESNTPVQTFNGSSLEATFTAKSTDSMFILNFEMESPFPVSTTLKPTTTTTTQSRITFPNSQSSVTSEKTTVRSVTENPLRTTTKMSNTLSGLLLIIVPIIFRIISH